MTHRYSVQSIERRQDILLLTLAPAGKPLTFEGGQYAGLSFKHKGRPTPVRCFSILSTPSGSTLQFALRVGGRFTKAASGLQPGDTVNVQGPFGDFVINMAYDRRVVMLAGGIGITPFLGMLRDLTERRVSLPVTLLFSNRSVKNIPFAGELQALAQQNPYLNVQFFTRDTTGSITATHIHQQAAADDTGTTTYFICGPKPFATGMQTMLAREGVHHTHIVTESFMQGATVTLRSGRSLPRLTYALSMGAFVLIAGAVTALDLTRAVPKLVQAESAVVPGTTIPGASPQTAAGGTTQSSGAGSEPGSTSSGGFSDNSPSGSAGGTTSNTTITGSPAGSSTSSGTTTPAKSSSGSSTSSSSSSSKPSQSGSSSSSGSTTTTPPTTTPTQPTSPPKTTQPPVSSTS